MSAKHTPGPWSLDAEHFVSTHRSTVYGPEGRQVARATSQYVDQSEADALLIATAPELLEALSQLYALGVANRTDSHEMDLARAAIAKATGGQP